jgi:hypothetical protein
VYSDSSLIAKDENSLCIFERQILRKTFGPVNIDSVWRIRNNMEIDNLIAKDENSLCIFERQILRKTFGSVNNDSEWRIRNNMEIYNLIEAADIVRFIKAQRIKWLGHI